MKNRFIMGVGCICLLLLMSGCSTDYQGNVQFEGRMETDILSETDQEENGQEKAEEEYGYYGKVIAAVRECIENKELLVPEGYGFSAALITTGRSMTQGYLIKDIDGDGTEELILGANGKEPGNAWDGIIFNIYTVSDGELVRVLNGWERNRYYFCENGMIANEGSSGAAKSDYSYFTFEGGKLHLVESVIYDGMKDTENPWFYSTESEYDAENAESISEEQAIEIREMYAYERPSFLPFEEKALPEAETAPQSGTEAAVMITYQSGGREKELFWRYAGENGEALFPEMAKEKEKIPYVPLGSGIYVHFQEGECPDEVMIREMILNEDGTEKYGEEAVTAYTRNGDDMEEGYAYIYLEVNRNAFASTDSDTYRKGGVLRGFRIFCSPGTEGEQEYDLLLRTDAAMGSTGKNEGVYLMDLCGTGIPIFADVTSVEKDADGLAVKMSLKNESSDTYWYGERYALVRLDQTNDREIPCRQGIGWNDVAYQLKKGKKAERTFHIGKEFGSLEPGVYAIQMELVNDTTGEIYDLSETFQFVE